MAARGMQRMACTSRQISSRSLTLQFSKRVDTAATMDPSRLLFRQLLSISRARSRWRHTLPQCICFGRSAGSLVSFAPSRVASHGTHDACLLFEPLPTAASDVCAACRWAKGCHFRSSVFQSASKPLRGISRCCSSSPAVMKSLTHDFLFHLNAPAKFPW